jgi:hypothetical protein
VFCRLPPIPFACFVDSHQSRSIAP